MLSPSEGAPPGALFGVPALALYRLGSARPACWFQKPTAGHPAVRQGQALRAPRNVVGAALTADHPALFDLERGQGGIVPDLAPAGERIYIQAKPYVLVPDVTLTVATYSQASATEAVGEVQSGNGRGIEMSPPGGAI